MKAHKGMTLGELAARYKSKQSTAQCKVPNSKRSERCAGIATGVAFRLNSGHWVCAQCAREDAIRNDS